MMTARLAPSLTTVDSAAPALEHAARSWTLNRLAEDAHATEAADVPAHLKQLSADGRRFELVIADPPNFAPSEAARKAALDSYAALHAGAFALLPPGGYYLAASCSSHISFEDFARGGFA